MAKKGELKNRIGEKWKTNENLIIEIVEYHGNQNCTVEFPNGMIRHNIPYGNIIKGAVACPVNRIGEIFTTNRGSNCKIIEYNTTKNVTVIFEDGTVIKNLQYHNIQKGKVVNPNHPSVCCTGFVGVGDFKVLSEGKMSVEYVRWMNMIKRCYSNNFPSYKETTVCKQWHSFQNFAKWFDENYNPKTMEGWHLDKDILVKGNKIYSPETCCFVPQEINTLFVKNDALRGNLPIGVSRVRGGFLADCRGYNRDNRLGIHTTPEEAFKAYKDFKEQYIKELADKWKQLVSEKIYKRLVDYEVEITD